MAAQRGRRLGSDGNAQELARVIPLILPFLSDLNGLNLCERVCGEIARGARDEQHWGKRIADACPMLTELRKVLGLGDGAQLGQTSGIPYFVQVRFWHGIVDCRTGKHRTERQLARFILNVADASQDLFSEHVRVPIIREQLGNYIPNANRKCRGVTKWCFVQKFSSCPVRSDLMDFYQQVREGLGFPRFECSCCEICCHCGVTRPWRIDDNGWRRCCGTAWGRDGESHFYWMEEWARGHTNNLDYTWFHSLCGNCERVTNGNLMSDCEQQFSRNCQGTWCSKCCYSREANNAQDDIHWQQCCFCHWMRMDTYERL